MSLKNNYWFRSGLINIIQNFSSLFLSFGGFYFLVRVLSKQQFGIWAIFLSTTAIIEMVRGGLLQSALIKHLSSANELDQRKILTASTFINGALSLIVCVLVFSLAGLASTMWNAPELRGLYYMYSVIFLITGLQTQFNCIEQANLSFKGVFMSNISRQALFLAYILFCFFTNYHTTVYQLFGALAVSSIVSTIISGVSSSRFLKFTKKVDFEWVRKLINYGKYTVGTAVSSQLAGTLDQMMLAAMLSPAAAGAFNIAVRITNLADIPTNAMATIVFPQTAKRMETDGPQAIKYLYEKSVGTILALLVPSLVFLYLFSDIVIHLIAGEKYADSIPLLKVTLIYSLFIPYGRQVGTIFDAIGKTRLNFILVVIAASLNIVFNYFLIHRFGVMGAAYASLCSSTIGFIIAQIILKRLLGVNVLNPWIYAWRFYPEMYRKFIKKEKVISEA